MFITTNKKQSGSNAPDVLLYYTNYFFMNTGIVCLVFLWVCFWVMWFFCCDLASALTCIDPPPGSAFIPLQPGFHTVFNPPGRHKLRRLPWRNLTVSRPPQEGTRQQPARYTGFTHTHTHDFYPRNIKT